MNRVLGTVCDLMLLLFGGIQKSDSDVAMPAKQAMGRILPKWLPAGQLRYTLKAIMEYPERFDVIPGCVAMKNGFVYVELVSDEHGKVRYYLLKDGIHVVYEKAQDSLAFSKTAEEPEEFIQQREALDHTLSVISEGEEEFVGVKAHYRLYRHQESEYRIYSYNREVIGFVSTYRDLTSTLIISEAANRVEDEVFVLPKENEH
ncbi:MAG: hypothetical protein LBR25_00505 [Erysipelotrichaceae bacterium]|jgi:hypothetical protein|nr:hypothetical protein [Erysipelotrichaceae bacterium]